ncbi:MAG: hypothetical protein Q9168_004487 [Polycauliona sp. 1 TL-2023]
MIYKEVFSSPTAKFKFSRSLGLDIDIFTSQDPQVTSILSTCRTIYNEAASIFYTTTYFTLDLGRNPGPGINAFIEKIGTRNMNLITKVALYRGSYPCSYPNSWWAQEYDSEMTLWLYTCWAQTFGPQLQELRLLYDDVYYDDFQHSGRRFQPSDLRIIDVLRHRTRVIVQSRRTLNRNDDGRYWRSEPTTHRLIVGTDGYRYEAFGEIRFENFVWDGDMQRRIVLRLSSMKDYRGCKEDV